MLLTLNRDCHAPVTVLCLGAHADDIEIGCGGTMLQLLAARSNVRVLWAIFSSPGEREGEARESAALFLREAAHPQVSVMKFRDGYFPAQWAEIKAAFQTLRDACPQPDLIFTHYRDDRHQDHRTISDLTWNTWRGHCILEYEIPKYDGDLGIPNCFVPITREAGQRKIEHICSAFRSERHKAWMTPDTFEAIMRLRGVECAAPEGWAEAFHGRKLVFSPAG